MKSYNTLIVLKFRSRLDIVRPRTRIPRASQNSALDVFSFLNIDTVNSRYNEVLETSVLFRSKGVLCYNVIYIVIN